MDEVGPATLIAALGGVLLLLAAFAAQFGWLGPTLLGGLTPVSLVVFAVMLFIVAAVCNYREW